MGESVGERPSIGREARPTFSSLRIRLSLLLLAALLPAYGLILYSAVQHRHLAAARAGDNALWLTRLLAAEQSHVFDDAREQLASLSQLPIVYRRDWTTLCARTFAKVLRQHPLYANLGVIGLDGRMRCSALPTARPIYLGDRSYFRAALQTRAFAIGDYQIGRATHRGSINFGYPVLDAASRPTAVVFVALDLAAWLDQVIRSAPLPGGSTLTLLDSHGTVLARHPDPSGWVGRTLADTPIIRTILAKRSEGSAEETDSDGVKRLYVFAPLYTTAKDRVYVSVGIPADVAFADVGRSIVNNLLLTALATAVVIAAAGVGSTLLVLRPVASLTSAARRLGEGNLAARTGLRHSADEFGQLARSLDDMAQSLDERERELRAAEAASRRAEQEVRSLNSELAQRVRERTAQLESANRELEAFSYSVSHDLRAPLRAIDGFSQALLEDYPERFDARGRDYLARVRAATQRMGLLIDDLLTLSRVTRADMKREPVDLSALAEGIAAELRKGEPGREVEWRIQPGVTAEGDLRLLRVALENLLGNAWKFTAKKPRSRIGFGVVPSPGGEPTYFVRDDGAGFDMTYADKLFRAFQRLHTPSEFPGTGIGLATVQRIVHRHGGRVRAEGAVGGGATFYFTLPAPITSPQNEAKESTHDGQPIHPAG